MEYCDLHCHSYYSDGTCTPEQLVEMACTAHLRAIALTDHNTLDGIADFIKAAEGKIEACSGCEFTTEADGQELHLLGLFLDNADLTAIRNAIAGQQARKMESNRRTIAALAKAGYDVTYDDFIHSQGNGVKNRVHIARFLMEKGIVSSVDEAFRGLLSRNGGYYQESSKLDFYEMISTINKAGGLSVWAHPLFHVDRERCELILRKAKQVGLDGVEVYYPTYSADDTAFMLQLCSKYNVLQSGGSDFHGSNKPSIFIGTGFGDLRVPYELYRRMKEYLDTKQR